ncbi:MAG: radical SAM protein [Desulfopila sp.]|jgi:pyruvate-formate lyase-activating enzyme|nr:radical SAM protein [Desulfopila sp.]
MHPTDSPSLVFADGQGNISDFSSLSMAGMSNGHYFLPELEDLIPLPEGSELFLLPDRLPVGIDPYTGEPLLLEEDPYNPGYGIQAVAAFMAPAHTSIFTSAFQSRKKNAQILPLFAYTAVGWYDDQFWVAAFRSDNDIRQDAGQFNQKEIDAKTRTKLASFPDNRLIQHLGKCCLTYCCPAARNYFLGRWEAPLPTSPTCNARCLGCISLQPSGCCPSTQERIHFVPTAAEITELAVSHLNSAERPVVSFGQGCEGEPLLQADTIEKAIKQIRKYTPKGTINLNSNASLPEQIEKLAKVGLDSLRVSLNSVQEKYYTAYYRPAGYSFSDVESSIELMKSAGKFVSLNYFILPGLTDSLAEFDSLCRLIEKYSPDLLQLRNLNMDPEWYLRAIAFPGAEKPMGIRQWRSALQTRFPSLSFGYFNPPLS